MGNSKSIRLREIDAWSGLVDGPPLLDDLSAAFHRHLALPSGAAETMAFWVLFAHTFEAARVSPRLALLSPLPECGKTTALSLLRRLVPRPLAASNMSPAVVFRAIQEYRPTLLMDEADTYLEQNEEFRGILNSGHTPDTASVWRCVGQDHDPKSFTTWAPMAIAKIGKLPDTLATRSIIIPMRRKRFDEGVEKFDPTHHGPILEELARKAVRWADDNLQMLSSARPELPKALNNRAADNWTPLIAIADVVGGEWPEKARQIALLCCEDMGEVTLVEQLLADICGVFDELRGDRISSHDLCEQLGDLESRPWANLDDGFRLSPNRLAILLRPFDIKPHGIRIGLNTPKGYMLKDFEDAFARYLPEKCNTATRDKGHLVEESYA